MGIGSGPKSTSPKSSSATGDALAGGVEAVGFAAVGGVTDFACAGVAVPAAGAFDGGSLSLAVGFLASAGFALAGGP